MSVIVCAMLFTHYIVPNTLPDIKITKQDGIPSDEYRFISSMVHFMVLVAGLNMYYPAGARNRDKDYVVENPRTRRDVKVCPPSTMDLTITGSRSMNPVTYVLLFYAVIKILSFFLVTSIRDASPDTQQLVRIFSAMGEVIALYVFLDNMHKQAFEDIHERSMHLAVSSSSSSSSSDDRRRSFYRNYHLGSSYLF